VASIRFENVTKEFDGLVAVDNLNLSIKDGEFYILLGPTGAGKTTSLRCLSGLDRKHDGKIFIDETEVSDWAPANRDTAMVFQQYSLYPHYTVRQNLEFPLKSKIRKLSKAEIEQRVNYAAETLKIGPLLERKTDKLSGGEMQRVSIGRAIVRQPKAFLMDEPLSSLDAKLRESLRVELKRLQKELGATLLFVTHDQVEAMSMADRIGVIKEGRLLQSDTPFEVYNHPTSVYVARFVGSPKINLFDGIIEGGGLLIKGSEERIQLEESLLAKLDGVTGDVIVGIRPEDVVVTPDATDNSGVAKVYVVEQMGMENLVSFRVDQFLFKASVDSAFEPAVHDKIHFSFIQDKLHFFEKKTEKNLIK
jgi:multiple sugar transport system ATP-binding protein